jgi:hypothetical protein
MSEEKPEPINKDGLGQSTTQFKPARPFPPDLDGGPVPVIDPDGPSVNPGKPGHHPPIVDPVGPAIDPIGPKVRRERV